MIHEEGTHQQSCLPFLRDKIAKNEVEKKDFERKREADTKKYEELERMAKRPRTLRYILTWNAKFPTPKNHQDGFENFYCTWNNSVGNLVKGTKKNNPKFQLDHGKMEVCLRLHKKTNRRSIGVYFYLTSGKKGRVKFNSSLSSKGKVLWQKERTEEIKVKNNDEDGWTGGNIQDDVPSDLPSNLLVVVEVIEWEPNTD